MAFFRTGACVDYLAADGADDLARIAKSDEQTHACEALLQSSGSEHCVGKGRGLVAIAIDLKSSVKTSQNAGGIGFGGRAHGERSRGHCHYDSKSVT
jgi:hypothetical protein